MSFCNYENVIDYCCNNFTYEYSDSVRDLGTVVPSGMLVYRTNKTTNEVKLISSLSLDNLISCSLSDEENNITDWECFKIYTDICNNSVISPSITTLIKSQIDNINTIYNTNNENIKVTLNDRNIILDASLESQAHLQATLALAHILYRESASSQMPYITDIYNRAYLLSYNNLKSVINSYLKTCISRQDQYADRLNRINNSDDQSYITNIQYYNKEKPQAYVQNTPLPIDDNIPDIMPELSPDADQCVDAKCWFCLYYFGESYWYSQVDGPDGYCLNEGPFSVPYQGKCCANWNNGAGGSFTGGALYDGQWIPRGVQC